MLPFHLALPSYDLQKTRDFYTNTLGMKEMRSAFHWVDYDFYGHQLSFHLVKEKERSVECTVIDGDQVPARHFGAILPELQWQELRDRLKRLNQSFIIGPRVRFAGQEGEQGTLFITDPSGNYLEFKYFTDTSRGAWY